MCEGQSYCTTVEVCGAWSAYWDGGVATECLPLTQSGAGLWEWCGGDWAGSALPALRHFSEGCEHWSQSGPKGKKKVEK